MDKSRSLFTGIIIFLFSLSISASFTACGGGGGNGGVKAGGEENAEISGIVSHFAGSTGGAGFCDGTGTAAKFLYPYGITSDGMNLYVTDAGNNTIRRIVIATGEVSTLAGYPEESGAADGTGKNARFAGLIGIACDGPNLYVADTGNQTIRRIVTSTGEVSTLAGTAGVKGSEDGFGTDARFNVPCTIACDGPNLYVSDYANLKIRKIVVATGEVSTLVTNIAAVGLMIDGTYLYASLGSQCAIQRINPGTGEVVATFSVSGGNGNVRGMTHDETYVYFTDLDNTVRLMDTTIPYESALAGYSGYFGAQDGIGNEASFAFPVDIVHTGTNLYVTDYLNNLIRRIALPGGEVTTFAGSRIMYGAEDGVGSSARFEYSMGIANDGANLYVADTVNSTIRKISLADASVSTFAGSAGEYGSTDGIGATARFNGPSAVTASNGNLYVTDTDNNLIRKISIATGKASTLAGETEVTGSGDGIGSAARFHYPQGITCDGTDLYVADTFNHTIRKIEISTGKVSTFAGYAGEAGTLDGTGTAARFYYPTGITCDKTNLYVADTENQTIRKIVIATGAVSTLAGTGGEIGSDNGMGASARFNYPAGVARYGMNLYVTDKGNNLIRKITLETGEVSTVAGKAGWPGSSDGTGAEAKFNYPQGITSCNGLYVIDTLNYCIRKIQ